MTEHISETAIESYLLGTAIDIDVDTIERHVADCEVCARRVRDELELELRLGEVGRSATFCPGCSRLVGSQRCDECGAALVAGSYRIERVLVRTTHGRLYVARDHNGHRVALKELAFIQTPSIEAQAAFERETKFLRALSHPGIPKFHASFVHGTGIHTRLYLAQDLVEGESLLARLATHWFDETEIVNIATRVLEILVYLQNLSPMIFHRDVKPANLIALPDGSIALVDFGAARDVSETMGNTSIGTFGYMPIEQMGGIVDATTDTYALGASLLHLLTRREPWKLLEAGPVGVNVSPALRKYLHKLVARRPQDRFPTARAALDALRAVHLSPRRPVKKIAVMTAVALAVAGSAVGGAMMLRTPKDPQARMRATVVKMDEFSKQMCSCLDKVCADKVNEELTKWGTEMARDAKPHDNDRPDPEIAKQAADIMQRYTECMTKLMLVTQQQQQQQPQPSVGASRSIKISDAFPQAAHAGTFFSQTFEVPISAGDVVVLSSTPDGTGQIYVDDTLTMTVTHPDASNEVFTYTGTGCQGQVQGHARPDLSAFFAPGIKRVQVELNNSCGGMGQSTALYFVIAPSKGVRSDDSIRPGQVTTRRDEPKRPKQNDSPRPTCPLEDRMPTGGCVGGEGFLDVQSRPPAKIFVDGVDMNVTTPTKLKLRAGKHKIMFVVGDTKSTFPVTVKDGETLKVYKDFSQ